MNPHDLPQQRQLADGLTIMGLEKDMVGGAVEVSYMYGSISMNSHTQKVPLFFVVKTCFFAI